MCTLYTIAAVLEREHRGGLKLRKEHTGRSFSLFDASGLMPHFISDQQCSGKVDSMWEMIRRTHHTHVGILCIQ